MPHASDIFPPSVQDKLFETDTGDVCLCLHEVWPSLLGDLSLLGPVMMISRSEQMALTSLRRQVEFVSVPGSTDMLDLSSGLLIDTLNLGAVIAGREGNTGHLTVHFFDLEGRGIFKAILAPGADISEFAQMISHYGKYPEQLNRAPGSEESLHSGAVLREDRAHLQTAWDSFNPALGGDFLPGGHGVSWLDALRLAGRERALFLTRVGLTKVILAAYRDQTRLRITCCQRGLHHETVIVPRRLERCSECLHLFDVESEAHFFLNADCEIWVGFHGPLECPAIHIFSKEGQRRGIIQFAGELEQMMTWDRAVIAAAGLTQQGE